MQLFLFRELLGSIRARSAVLFTFSWFLLFLFLVCVACFFMISPGDMSPSVEGQPIEEIRVFLSPRLSSATIDQWFLEWRERTDIDGLRFGFAQEFDPSATGGVFILSPTDTAVAASLSDEFRRTAGVTKVVEVRSVPAIKIPSVFLIIRIALLVILLLSIVASLYCSRRGYHALLTAFSGEIRMLRLSGIPMRIMFTMVIALGLLLGLLGGLFLLAVLYLLHQIALSNVDAFSMFGGLTSEVRILTVGLMGVVLGTLLGGLAGLLGASLLHRPEFDPLP